MCRSQCDLPHQWVRCNSRKSVKSHILTIWISSPKTIFKHYKKLALCQRKEKEGLVFSEILMQKTNLLELFFLFMYRAKLVPGGYSKFV